MRLGRINTISTITRGLSSPEGSFGDEKSDDTGLDNRRFSFADVGDPSEVGLPRGLLRS